MAEDVAAKFEAAWEVFSRTCGGFVAPEASYQAWFAHYLISQFGIDRVAREPILKHKYFASTWRSRIAGNEVKLDVVVTREPGVDLPHYASNKEVPSIERLRGLAVISELKVATSTAGGLTHTAIRRDIDKLSMLLDEAERCGVARPLAYVCVLDNHPKRRYNRAHLARGLERDPCHTDVRLLYGPPGGSAGSAGQAGQGFGSGS